ncbi:hypothetical protein BC941DRAFT_151300 [Chlamydoabsidia padenii]|nr:hypothetical protein BC941DRAFT_151300 [Chlamydoabsidia padenii]
MGNGLGMCLLTKGRWSVGFDDMDDDQRQAVLLSWKTRKSPHYWVYRLFCMTALFLTYSAIHHQDCPIHIPLTWPVAHWAGKQFRYDAILIGSGAAAGPCALELSKAGKSVLVIEKGSILNETRTNEPLGHLSGYDKKCYQTSLEGNLIWAAGSTFGGGTSISHGALVKTPLNVLQDWKRRTNEGFDVAAFEKDLQVVYDQLGTSSDHLDYTLPNRTLIHGCQQLGYPVSMMPHATNDTSLWLQQAQSYGTQFLLDAQVTQILIRYGHADGVICTLSNGEQVTIQARTVIAAAGAIHTPALLLKSGLKNKHIGQHLRVHPTVFVNGYFPSSSSQQQDGTLAATHHMNSIGCRIEAPVLDPGLYATTMNWHGGLHHKQSMLGYADRCSFKVMGRDMHSTGSTTKSGRVKFDFSERDLDTLNQGVIRALDILVAAGARHLHTCHLDLEPFVFKSSESISTRHPRYLYWLEQIRHSGLTPADGIFSNHQMGSCRLGHSSKTSAVQLTGETWEVKNLYVADGSIMPSACGVNPILTIQTLALGVAKKVLLRLESKSINIT